MSASTQVRIPPAETEIVNIPETQLKVSRVALGTSAMGGWMWGGTEQREVTATSLMSSDV
jgi:aryl-alcohol dehydrogenase-like predicted oxidoreductase